MRNDEAPIIFIIGTLTLCVFVFFLVIILIEYRKRQVRHITENLKLKHQYQNEVLQTQLEVQEQSFKYMSEEIHDNIAQTLSLAKLKLYKTIDKINDEKIKESLEMSSELVGNALKDLRNLSHVLNGGLISKISLRESIEKELNYVSDVKDIKTVLTISGNTYEPDPEKKLIIFRIVQEAVNNAIKHGEAKEINIILAYEPDMLNIQITDDGRGFDIEQIQKNNGLGLHNMHIRAKLLGGIHFKSEIGKGTTITLNIKTHEYINAHERKNKTGIS
jgi:two-component system NarL family sensor kinase